MIHSFLESSCPPFSPSDSCHHFMTNNNNLYNSLIELKDLIELQKRLRPLREWLSIRKREETLYINQLHSMSAKVGRNILRVLNNPRATVNLSKFDLGGDKNLVLLQEDFEDIDGIFRDYQTDRYRDEEVNREINRAMLPILGILGYMFFAQSSLLADRGKDVFKVGYKYAYDIANEPISNAELLEVVDLFSRDKIDFLLDSHSYPSAQNTVAKYIDNLESILRDGFRKQLPRKEIYNNIKEYVNYRGGNFPDYIYERIARNEFTRFGNEAKVEAWLNLGIKYYKWIQGPGPCNEILICETMAKGGPYKVGEGPMPIDDTHLNCLCEIEAVIAKKQ